jgi:hypothetical protein
LALTPTDNEAFLREVDDNLRRDQLTGLLTRWGKVLAGAVGLFLVLLAAFLWWQDHRAKQAGVDAEQLSQALNDIDGGLPARAAPALTKLADSPRDGYRAAARLAQAALSLTQNKPAEAAAAYDAIAADTSLPQAARDLALLRGVAIQFDTLPPAKVVERLKPLAIVGNPWFGSAGEMTAAAYLKMNRRDQAGPLLAAIARDASVPLSLRGRVAGLATSLGQTVPPIGPGATAGEE